jgi:hypothetical protein
MPSFSGFVELALFQASNPVTTISWTYVVPPSPTSADGQYLIFWGGLQNLTDLSVLQPLLEWTSGSGIWQAYCAWVVNNITQSTSAPVNVSPGDVLQASITFTGMVGTSYGYTASFGAPFFTSLSIVSLLPLDLVAFALEVNGVVNCSDYPANPSTAFTNISIQTGSTFPIPAWALTINQTNCYQQIVINSNSNPNGVLTFYYGAIPTPGDSDYSFVSLVQAQSDLGARLYDPTNQFWSAAELSAYLLEALQEWNALTSWWATDFTFTLSPSSQWYDLTLLPGSPRPLTVTDQTLLSLIEYHLLEPQTPNYPLAWLGSSQFALSDILGAIQRRRDETLSLSGCQLTRSVIPVPFGRVYLTDSTIDVRRVAWFPQTGLGYSTNPLYQADGLEKEYFSPGWTTGAQGPPNLWLESTQPPLSFDVDTTPPVSGNFELLLINAGPALSQAQSTILGIPDDWAWVVKWGALGDLLSREGSAKDPLRATYANKRYREGIVLLSQASALLLLRVNNLPLETDAVRNGDNYNVGWQGLAPGAPQVAYVAGLNLIAFPTVDGSTYSILGTVVQNAPFTDANGNLQVARENYDVILDEAQHLAMFKVGGQEFVSTFPLRQRFLKQASIYNSKLTDLGDMVGTILDTSSQESRVNPVFDQKLLKETQ